MQNVERRQRHQPVGPVRMGEACVMPTATPRSCRLLSTFCGIGLSAAQRPASPFYFFLSFYSLGRASGRLEVDRAAEAE
jgi:hypothetical protein